MLSLIKFKSIAHIGRTNVYYVDIIRDVITLFPIHCISEKVVRALCIVVYAAPINMLLRISFRFKTTNTPNGTWREYEISEKFADITEQVLMTVSSVPISLINPA